MNYTGHARGRGGGVLPYVCATRETPIFSPKFPFRSISFSQMTKKSGPEHHHFKYFAVPETIIFKNFFNFNPFIASHSRLSPNAKRSAAPRFSGRPECQPDASWQFRSPTFSCSYGSSSVRSPTFSRSTVELGPEPGAIFHFAAAHTYQIWGEYPPPPPPPGGHAPQFTNQKDLCKKHFT